MRTSNVGLLAEIDGLSQMSCCDAEELQVVQHIEMLEKNQAQKCFFIVTNIHLSLYFNKRENAESFINKQSETAGLRLICSSFCDID
jgi:hypothetical protein